MQRLLPAEAAALRGATPSVACGDSSPKGTPLGDAGNFAVTTEAVPLGKVAANAVSRRKGYSRGKWLYT